MIDFFGLKFIQFFLRFDCVCASYVFRAFVHFQCYEYFHYEYIHIAKIGKK